MNGQKTVIMNFILGNKVSSATSVLNDLHEKVSVTPVCHVFFVFIIIDIATYVVNTSTQVGCYSLSVCIRYGLPFGITSNKCDLIMWEFI